MDSPTGQKIKDVLYHARTGRALAGDFAFPNYSGRNLWGDDALPPPSANGGRGLSTNKNMAKDPTILNVLKYANGRNLQDDVIHDLP